MGNTRIREIASRCHATRSVGASPNACGRMIAKSKGSNRGGRNDLGNRKGTSRRGDPVVIVRSSLVRTAPAAIAPSDPKAIVRKATVRSNRRGIAGSDLRVTDRSGRKGIAPSGPRGRAEAQPRQNLGVPGGSRPVIVHSGPKAVGDSTRVAVPVGIAAVGIAAGETAAGETAAGEIAAAATVVAGAAVAAVDRPRRLVPAAR